MVKLVIAAAFFFYFPFWFAKNSTLNGRSKWFFLPVSIVASLAGIAALFATTYVMVELLKSNNVFNASDSRKFIDSDITYWFFGTFFVLPVSLWQGVRKSKPKEIDKEKEGSP
jgi:glucan phosphoethanolaminetransferase (alkaline phosphatase superfamily)